MEVTIGQGLVIASGWIFAGLVFHSEGMPASGRWMSFTTAIILTMIVI